VRFSLPSDRKTSSLSQLSSSSTPHGENESIYADDDNDDVQEAAAAFINASIYTPVHNKLTNTYPILFIEVDRMEMWTYFCFNHTIRNITASIRSVGNL